MHTYVHSGTVYSSKDLEPTQMPTDDRLDKEIVAHIPHGIVCSHKKWLLSVLCRDMDESENHNPQQTDTRTKNQTLHILTHGWVLNNENTWTLGEEHHTLGSLAGGQGRDSRGVGRSGKDNIGRNARCRCSGIEAANHIAMCVPMQQSCMFFTYTPESKIQ